MTSRSITVTLPDNTEISSQQSGTLTVGQISFTCHVFADKDLHHTLISLADFANRGCEITLTATHLNIKHNNVIILTCSKEPSAKLWTIPISALQDNNFSVNNIISNQILAEKVKTQHATLGSPTNKTLLKALKNNWLGNFQLTYKEFQQNQPNSLATAYGHLNRNRQGQRSTKPTTPPIDILPILVAAEDDDDDEESAPVMYDDNESIHFKTLVYGELHEIIHSDATGKFPIQSLSGNNYIVVFYYKNYLYAVAIKNRTSQEYQSAFEEAYEHFFKNKHPTHQPIAHRLDNEISFEIKEFITSKGLAVQLVPPNSHRALRAERGIQTYKNHLISTLCTADTNFHLSLWDKSLHQVNIIINLLRPYLSDPSISAYEGLHKTTYDFNAHPIGIFGALVVVHEAPNVRATWDKHGQLGFYIKPSSEHYRCYSCYIISTKTMRTTDTLAWFVENFHMPNSDPISILYNCVNTLLQELDNKKSSSTDSDIIAYINNFQNNLLRHTKQLNNHSFQRVQNSTNVTPLPLNQYDFIAVDSNKVQTRSNTANKQRQSSSIQNIQMTNFSVESIDENYENQLQVQHIDTEKVDGLTISTPSFIPSIESSPKLYNGDSTNNTSNISTSSFITTPAKSTSKSARNRRNRKQKRLKQQQETAEFNAQLAELTRPHINCILANESTTHAYAHNTVSSSEAHNGPDKDKWAAAELIEFIKLIEDTQTMHPIFWTDKPTNKKATYYHPQYTVKEKWNEATQQYETKYRCRGTAGGNILQYDGKTKANVADIQTVKTLINSAISTANGDWFTADITDFYLGTPLDEPEYLIIQRSQLSQQYQDKYNDPRYWKNDTILMKVVKTIYGLKQSGLLSQKALVQHLKDNGYAQTKSNECLFTNLDNTVQFSLVVDDFGIKYTNIDNAKHLVSVLQMKYGVTVDWKGTKYLGMHIDFQKEKGRVHISMPTYVDKALSKLDHKAKSYKTHSAVKFQKLEYSKAQIIMDEDTSRKLDPVETKRLQSIIGIFLYYARIIDSTMLPAVNILSTKQSNPTTNDLAAAEVLMDYAHSYPNEILEYKRSDMILKSVSDTTYLSERNSSSRVGGIHYLGNKESNPVQFVNGAIDIVCKLTDTKVSSACSSEYVGLFINANIALVIRNTLEDLGHPQPPTVIITDNKCAEGIANRTCKLDKSKAINMRYHYTRELVDQGIIIIRWQSGKTNLADFFTKIQPVKVVKEMRHIYLKAGSRSSVSKGVLKNPNPNPVRTYRISDSHSNSAQRNRN